MTRTGVNELVGRTSYNNLGIVGWADTLYPSRPLLDYTRADYAFWDKLRHGKLQNYELGSLFAKPILEINESWTLGKGYGIEVEGLSEAAAAAFNEALDGFISDYRDDIASFYTDGNGLGDSYIVVNPDASLVNVPPDQMKVDLIPGTRRQVRSYISQFETEVPTREPSIQELHEGVVTPDVESLRVTDRFMNDSRTIITQLGGAAINDQSYPNPTGMFPVVHWCPGRTSNEVYGRPIYESLRYLFARYDNAIQKALDGVEMMGRPVPVAEGLEDPEAEKRANMTGTKLVRTAGGEIIEMPQIDFAQNPMLFLGAGGSFKFAQPNAFTTDTGNMLEYLFLLMLQHTQIIEGVWGAGLKSSRASLEAQLPIFAGTIDRWRRDFEKTLLQLAKVWLAWKGLTMPTLRLPQEAKLVVRWKPVLPKDMNLILEKVKFVDERSYLTPANVMRELGFDTVEDPEAEVKAAQAEAAERAREFIERSNPEESDIDRLANEAEEETLDEELSAV